MPLYSSMDGTSAEVVEGLLTVCFPKCVTILDATYGNGMFWRGSSRQVVGMDIDPSRAKDIPGNFTQIPQADQSYDVVVFDPPFQPATTDGLIGKRFSKPVHGVAALRTLVEAGLKECWRVSRQGVIVKVQDYIHDHKPVWMSSWVHGVLGEPYDFCTLRVKSKLKATNWTRQLSVWRNHSTFWVYVRPDFRFR